MEIQNKKITNPRYDRAWTWLTDEDGFISSERQIVLGLLFKVLAFVALFIFAGILIILYFILPFFVRQFIGAFDFFVRNLTSGETYITSAQKAIAAKWISFLVLVMAFFKVKNLNYTSKTGKEWKIDIPKDGFSLAEVYTDRVPPNCVGVPIIFGQLREGFLYLPADKIVSPFGAIKCIAVEATSQTLDISIKELTSSDKVEVIGDFSIIFQVYDYYTASMVELANHSNIYAQVLDLLQGNVRTAVNSLTYNQIDSGRRHGGEMVNERLMEVLRGIYSPKDENGVIEIETDPRISSDNGGKPKGHEIIKVGNLGIYIHTVVCKRLIAADDKVRRAREAKMRADGEAIAQVSMIKKLKKLPEYDGLNNKQLVDQANLMLDRFHEEFFFDFADAGAGALEKILATIIAKYGKR